MTNLELFQNLMRIHIVSGTIGLLSGTIALSVTKGSPLHKTSGKIFVYSMITVALTAFWISRLPNHISPLLFAIAGFTLYMALSGYRTIVRKNYLQGEEHYFSSADSLIMIFGTSFGLFLILQAVTELKLHNTFSLVPALFGIICLSFSSIDLQYARRKRSLRRTWIANHISRMMGAMIAAYTAFLVVNVHMKQEWLIWLLPTVIGSRLISRFSQKYVKKV